MTISRAQVEKFNQPKSGNGAPNNASSQTKNYEITHGHFSFQGDGEIILFEPFPVSLGGTREAAINILFRQVRKQIV